MRPQFRKLTAIGGWRGLQGERERERERGTLERGAKGERGEREREERRVTQPWCIGREREGEGDKTKGKKGSLHSRLTKGGRAGEGQAGRVGEGSGLPCPEGLPGGEREGERQGPGVAALAGTS